MIHNTPEFELLRNDNVNFLEKLTEVNIPYTKAHEDVIAEWAYEQSTSSQENFSYIEQMGGRLLAIYDAYISMQMQLNIEPIYDLEFARVFKRIIGMNHNSVIKLQNLALSAEFSTFFKSINMLGINQRKKLWDELIKHNKTKSPTVKSFFALHKKRRKKTKEKYKKAVKSFLKIPLYLRNFDELKFIKIDNLKLLLDYAKREKYRKEHTMFATLAGERFEGIKMNREKIKEDKKLRMFMEIWQRNGSATEEFNTGSFNKPNPFKVGEISEILSLLAHIDPKKRRKTTKIRNITNDAVFRSVMAFMREQLFFMNNIYILPKNQFTVMNDLLEQKHGFRLKEDTNDVIQKTLETGGAYALYSNHYIRSSKSDDEKNKYYLSFGKRPNLTFIDVVRNPSSTEKLSFQNTEKPGTNRPPLHIFRGNDIFNVLQIASDTKAKKAKDYMQAVERHGYKVSAGISGTTAKLFAIAEALGLLKHKEDHKRLLIACIGYMVPLNHHSLYEITSTLRSFNIPYKHTLSLVDSICDFMQNEELNEKMVELNERKINFKKVIEELRTKEIALKNNTPRKRYAKSYLNRPKKKRRLS